MYLNLDLLYNVGKYFFVLFYYNKTHFKNYRIVYSPVTKKGIYFGDDTIYLDYSTLNLKCKRGIFGFSETEFKFKFEFEFEYRCKPFLFSNKKDLIFLKSNKRIFLKKI